MINVNNISIAFGHVTLLDRVNLRIDNGERLCLIGRNGEGKSTLLKIISQKIFPDEGKIEMPADCRITLLDQEHEFDTEETVFSVVSQGLGNIGRLIDEYHTVAQQLTENENKTALLAQLDRIQHLLEVQNGWHLKQRVETVLSKLNLSTEQKLSKLSGGWRRRVALAQTLVAEPHLLLLDEPTNHLDIEAITWLESLLIDFKGSVLFVSHDRSFMQRIATRIIELDRGKLTSYLGNYDSYLRTKEANLESESVQNAKFDKFLANEEVWIRQGIKARRTRNEGRVRRLERMRFERSQRRDKIGNVRLNVDSGELSGHIVIEANNIHMAYQGTVLIDHFSTLIMRGDRVGLIGANGIGKTTLLKILLGELSPERGTIKHGTKLNIAYFDQLREQLDPEKTVVDTLGQENVTINGHKKHVMSYLSDFLFAPERARSPVKSLSGGERNRLLLARLFTKPSNVLVMDEPTNDLDVETLELLEEILSVYSGTLLLVSHDRRFLDNVVTSTLVFEGKGRIAEYVGGYEDYLNQRPAPILNIPPKKSVEFKPVDSRSKSRKITYKEQRELAELPSLIEHLEKELADLQSLTRDSAFYRREKEEINSIFSRIQSAQFELETLYSRWEALEEIGN